MAGYTANTSCGRMGRGGNTRFHTFQLDHHDGPTNGPTDRRTDKASYRVACPQLKITYGFFSWTVLEMSHLCPMPIINLILFCRNLIHNGGSVVLFCLVKQ